MKNYYQYVPLSKPRALTRMLPKIQKIGCRVIFDLEDSVQDTLNPENTPLLKKEAREGLIYLLEAKPEIFNQKLNIRVNCINSDEFLQDIEIIERVARKKKCWDAIWLPMSDSVEYIQMCLDELSRRGLDSLEIIPIIETVKGVENLESIAGNAKDMRISRIHYGHYDFCLDAKIWPFYNQDTEKFWQHVEMLIKCCRKYNLHYIQTPFGDLDNSDLFLKIDKKLKQLCSDFSRTTLNYGQSELIKKQLPSTSLVEKDINYTDSEKHQLAQETMEVFTSNRCSKRSFSVHHKDRKFITPHEYKAAQNFLKEVKNET